MEADESIIKEWTDNDTFQNLKPAVAQEIVDFLVFPMVHEEKYQH